MWIGPLLLLALLSFSYPASAQTCLSLHRMVDGAKVCLTQMEEDTTRAEWEVWDARLPERKKVEARAESTVREDAGVTVSGVVLDTDADGISRLHILMVSAQRKEATGQTINLRGRAKDGSRIIITSAAQAEALFDAASEHIASVQIALDNLYDEIDGMTITVLKTFDVSTWVGWPD